MKEWLAVVRYKTKIEPGIIEIEYDLDHPGELAIIINQGPGWAALSWVQLRRSDDERFPAIPLEDLPHHNKISDCETVEQQVSDPEDDWA